MASAQPRGAPHIIIVTGPPTVLSLDLNPKPFSLEANTFLTEITSHERFAQQRPKLDEGIVIC